MVKIRFPKAVTLLEIIVVLVIIVILTIVVLPNFTRPSEQSKALNANNNLLAIYSAQQNYNYNNGNYCYAGCDTLAHINTVFTLNIMDDGSYTYACSQVAGTCTATRVGGGLTLTLTLAAPVIAGTNPVCAGTIAWCP